jgi:hypothetical protein
MYRTMISSCLQSSEDMNPLIEDEHGKSALFIFCERLSKVNADAYPEAVSILKMVLEHIPGGGIGGADRTGRTIFDIEEDHRSTSGYSCLKASRQLLVEAGTMTPSRRNGKSRLRFSSS